MQLTNLQGRILVLLQDSPTPLTANEIQEKLNLKYSTLALALRQLVTFECVKRSHGGRNGGYKYTFVKGTPGKVAPKKKTIQHKDRIHLTRDDVESLLTKWATGKWEPKIFESARNLPKSVARYYELAIEMAFGSKVTHEQIFQVRQDLEKFQTDLEQTLRVVKGFISHPKLKDPDDLYIFLLPESDQIERLRKLAQETKEKN